VPKPFTRKQRLCHRRRTLRRRLRAAYWFHRVFTTDPAQARQKMLLAMNAPAFQPLDAL